MLGGSTLRRGVSLGVLALLVSVIAWGSPAAADPAGDKTRVDAEIASTAASLEAATGKAQQAAATYLQATAALPAAQTALADARGRVAAAEVAQRQAQRDYAAAKGVSDAATAAFDQATAKVEQARAQVSSFVSAAYKGSSIVVFDSILASGSPAELVQRIGYLDQVAGDERRALEEVTELRSLAKDRQNEAEVARQKAEQAQRVAAAALAESQSIAASAEQVAAQLQKLIDVSAQAKSVADGERDSVLAQYENLKAESEQIAQELRGSTNTDPAPAQLRPGAFFLMPTQGYKSSDFGMRWDPYYRVWQLHAGVDIAAPGGQPIYAAADGTVARAGWTGGYGNYTCISHGSYQGRNLATCYGHQSQLLVGAGQWVSRGQLIGRVGTTGASTGNHLHFEVRLNGEPVNPLGWLPSCLC